jgi:uncharacterized lipoprotein YmbA
LTASDSDKPLSSRHVRLSAHAASSSYSDQVAAMSKIVGELSDNIARDLASAPVHVAR